MFNHLDEYVSLIVRVGVNIQKGQKLVISSPVECADFARRLCKEAYLAGAKDVFMRWRDDEMSKIRLLNAPDEVIDYFPGWTKMMMDSLLDEGAAYISISADNPEALLGVDLNRIMRWRNATRDALKEFQERVMANEVQWCVASIPTPDWAKKVFPGEAEEAAMEKLWQAIFHSSRINESGAVENWRRHKETLDKRSEALNNYNFKSLRFKNSIGTDLEIELPEGHIWSGGGDVSQKGVRFMPNIPTEEIFTAPKRCGANGVVVSSKPLVYSGNLIESFTVEFKDGKAVHVTAEKNADLLKQLISSTPNADYLGEIALVPYDSPISNSNILYYNTLYDENASCHLAFGKAYPSCVKGAEGKTDEQLEQMGINPSKEHSDFMIGTSDLNITGVTGDGREVAVFVNGNFAF